jgi:branched-chain amino acid transport system ATP-binding protein
MLQVRHLSKRFGGVIASDHIDLDVEAGCLHAIIGPNGAGKTTLVAQLCGEVAPDSGTITFGGRDITRLPVYARARLGLGRSFQITSVVRQMTALENVMLSVQARAPHSFRFWRPAREDVALRDPAHDALRQVGLGARADVPAAGLAHGERRALEIAIALATGPTLLLLDEPMAGMGPEDSAGMVTLLASLKGRYTIVLIEHDMDAVFALADVITVLVYGRVVATGAPDEIRANSEVRRAYLGEARQT